MFFNLQQISSSKAQMNLEICFTLYSIHRYTVVTLSFKLNFVRIFLSELANVSASDRYERNFPIPKMVWEKENLLFNQIGLKMKKNNQKRAYELFGFSFLGLKTGANCSSIKFCIKQPIHFFQKCRHSAKKSSQT